MSMWSPQQQQQFLDCNGKPPQVVSVATGKGCNQKTAAKRHFESDDEEEVPKTPKRGISVVPSGCMSFRSFAPFCAFLRVFLRVFLAILSYTAAWVNLFRGLLYGALVGAVVGCGVLRRVGVCYVAVTIPICVPF